MGKIGDILFDERMIGRKVSALAERISHDYEGKDLIMIGILKGAFVFTADLARAVSLPIRIEFVQAASYGAGTTSSQTIVMRKDSDTDLRGKHVLLVDTIIDSGQTLAYLFKTFSARGPASLNAVTLLDKTSRRIVPVPIAYQGFEIPDVFVVGYGMDYGEKYRNLPYIAALPTPEKSV